MIEIAQEELMQLAEAIRAWRDWKHWTQKQLGDALGVDDQTVWRWEQGLVKKIPPGRLRDMYRLYNCTGAEAFLEGPPAKEPSLSRPPMSEPRPVPWYDRVDPKGWEASSPDSYIPVPPIFASCPDPALVTVRTAGMRPRITEGDLILVDRSLCDPREGWVILASVGDRVLIRRYRAGEGVPLLSPDNRRDSIPDISVDSNFLCLGKVTFLAGPVV